MQISLVPSLKSSLSLVRAKHSSIVFQTFHLYLLCVRFSRARPPKSHYFTNSICTQLDTFLLPYKVGHFPAEWSLQTIAQSAISIATAVHYSSPPSCSIHPWKLKLWNKMTVCGAIQDSSIRKNKTAKLCRRHACMAFCENWIPQNFPPTWYIYIYPLECVQYSI